MITNPIRLVRSVGDSAQIHCGTPFNIMWNFENGALPTGVHFFSYGSGHTLVIRQVERKHFGTYACIGKDEGFRQYEYFMSESHIEESKLHNDI